MEKDVGKMDGCQVFMTFQVWVGSVNSIQSPKKRSKAVSVTGILGNVSFFKRLPNLFWKLSKFQQEWKLKVRRLLQ